LIEGIIGVFGEGKGFGERSTALEEKSEKKSADDRPIDPNARRRNGKEIKTPPQ